MIGEFYARLLIGWARGVILITVVRKKFLMNCGWQVRGGLQIITELLMNGFVKKEGFTGHAVHLMTPDQVCCFATHLPMRMVKLCSL
ncbi:hypothetical protein D3C75_1285130 [compost metagenome]